MRPSSVQFFLYPTSRLFRRVWGEDVSLWTFPICVTSLYEGASGQTRHVGVEDYQGVQFGLVLSYLVYYVFHGRGDVKYESLCFRAGLFRRNGHRLCVDRSVVPFSIGPRFFLGRRKESRGHARGLATFFGVGNCFISVRAAISSRG